MTRRAEQPAPSIPKARLFVALDLPAIARAAIARWRATAVAGRDELRPVPVEALHVTLAFLGHLPETEIARVAETVAATAESFGPACLAPIGTRPVPPRRPRLFALDLADEGGRAGAVQAAVAAALEAASLYTPERRPFWPHVTFARVRRGRRAAAIPGGPPTDPFEAGEVTLYRSRLSPRGARYEPLARVSLTG